MVTIYYLDTSAWLKRYVTEAGTDVVASLFDGGERIGCSLLGRVEITAALSRRSRSMGDVIWDDALQSRIERDWNSYLQIRPTDETWSQSLGLAGSFGLRAADAVHLASAAELKAQLRGTANLTFMSSDFDLNQAAQALGLRVLDPAQQDR